jgi:hypothetical protein
MKIVVEAERDYDSSFSWIPKTLGSLLFSDLYHFCDTCSTEASLSFGRDLALGLAYHPFCCSDLFCCRRLFPSSLAEVG